MEEDDDDDKEREADAFVQKHFSLLSYIAIYEKKSFFFIEGCSKKNLTLEL